MNHQATQINNPSSDKQGTENFIIESSRSGAPTLLRILPDGTRKNIHSAYDPIKEAKTWIENLQPNQHANYLIFGLGLGYHILELVKQTPQSSQIILVEPDPEIIELAREQEFLHPLFSNQSIQWITQPTKQEWKNQLYSFGPRFALNNFQVAAFGSVVEDNLDVYQEFLNEFNGWISELRVDMNTQAALSKKFFTNFSQNLISIRNSIPLSQIKGLAKGKSALLISAGPSLDKNIGWIKGAQSNGVLILAVATAFIPLTSAGIQPDFVLALDPNEVSANSFNLEELPEHSWLVYDPVIPKSIIDMFGSKSIAIDSNNPLSSWILSNHDGWGSLGPCMSVAHMGLRFSKYIGCEQVVLIGQDLAYDGQRLHCTDSHHMDSFEHSTEPDITREQFEGNRFQSSGTASIEVYDLFGKAVTTTQSLEAFRRIFSRESGGETKIINATEGGVPIPGMENISLREILHRMRPECKMNDIFKKLEGLDKVTLPQKNIEPVILKIREFISDLQGAVNIVASDHSNQQALNTDFEKVLQTWMQDSEIFHLVHGYFYQEFLDRERLRYQAELSNNSSPNTESLNEGNKVFAEKLLGGLPQLLNLFEDIKKVL